MKINKIKYSVLVIISIIVLLIIYVIIQPSVINYQMKKNYSNNKNKFQLVRTFLSKHKIEIKNIDGNFLVNNDNHVSQELTDSLRFLLNNIECKNIIGLSNKADSIKLYLLIYYHEFWSSTYAYLITYGNKRPLKELYVPDGFYDYNWLDNEVLCGNVKWN